MSGYPGYNPNTYRLQSSTLFDPATRIGRSSPHPHGSLPDLSGTPVGVNNTIISDGSFSLVPSGFQGPVGTREVHTEIVSLNMTGAGGTVRAGTMAPNQPMSPGEVESKQTPTQPDFPAESFFDVFVEVDLPNLGGKTAKLVNLNPMLITDSNLQKFPPKVVYIHGNSTAVPVVFSNDNPGKWYAGALFGYLVLAGHGISYTKNETEYFEKHMMHVPEMPLAPVAHTYNPANTPGTGGSNSWPFNLYTGWRFQFIIHNKVLGSIPFAIKDIAFAPTFARTFSAHDFQMRMGHTQYNQFSTAPTPEFDKVLGSSPTEVYRRGPISWNCKANTWCDIGLTTPFNYDGKSNICVEIRYNSTTSAGVSTRTSPNIPRAYTHSRYSKDPFNEKQWYVPIPGEMMGPIHRLTVEKCCTKVLTAPSKVKLGGTAPIQFNGANPGDLYQIASAFGNTQIPLGTGSIFLAMDGLFVVSLWLGPPVCVGYAGPVHPTGVGMGQLVVPKIPGIVGLNVFSAAVTYNKGGLAYCYNTARTSITP